MSSNFESAFKDWLTHRDDDEEDDIDEEDGERVDDMQHNGQDDAEEGKPHSDGETWDEDDDEDMNEMPILQKIVDLPSKQTLEHGIELGPSPPPPPLQKSHSVRSDLRNDEQKDGEHIAACKSRLSRKVRNKASSHTHKTQRVHVKHGQQQRHKGFNENVSRKEDIQMDKQFPLTNCRKSLTSSRPSSKEADCYPSPVHLTVDHDSINSYNSSPSSPCLFGDIPQGLDLKNGHMKLPSARVADSGSCLGRELRKGWMLSPERDLVEPDSTSEMLDAPDIRESQEGRRKVELNRVNRSVRRIKNRSNLGTSAEVIVHTTEEGIGECDSTSMFLASPSAISPASQGEIEERVCPLMVEHDDSARSLREWGTGHCICQCHTLVTPPHLPFIPPEKSSSSGSSKNSQTPCHLVRKSRHHSHDSLPHLEKMPAYAGQNESLDEGRTGSEICESPPVLSLPELDLQGEQTETSQLGSQVHQGVLLIKVEPVETPPLLVKYEVEDKAHNCRHHNDILEDFTFDERPPVLILPMKEYKERTKGDSGKKHSSHKKRSSGARRKQARSPPCLTKYEAKPSESGIVLKLRAKRPMLDPEMASCLPKPQPRNDLLQPLVEKQKVHSCEQVCLDHKPGQEPVPKAAVSEKTLLPPKQEPEQDPLLRPRPATRRRHTVDSPEVVRSLRRRKRSSEPEQADGDFQLHSRAELCEEMLSERDNLEARAKRQKAGLGGSTCSCCLRSSPKRKRRRRNTVHLGDPSPELSPVQQDFVLFSLKLSRLQTCTHNLVCTLFPRLAPSVQNFAPESQQFLNFVDDIIGSLQRSELEENVKDSADLSCLMESLSLVENHKDGRVPIFLPKVVVCQSPQHSLEEFQDKVCAMLQLLLPDITVSLSDNLFHTSEELELLLERVIAANAFVPTKKY